MGWRPLATILRMALLLSTKHLGLSSACPAHFPRVGLSEKGMDEMAHALE